MKILIPLFTLFISTLISAQNYDWKKDESVFPTYGSQIIEMPNGDLTVFGTDSLNLGDGLQAHMYFSFRDANGDSILSKSVIPSTGGLIQAYHGECFNTTADGGFILGGVETTNNGHWNACVVKTDAQANIQWYNVFWGNTGIVKGIEQTFDGGFAMITEANTIYRLDAAGDSVWAMSMGNGGGADLVIDDNDNIVVCGNISGFAGTNTYAASFTDGGNNNWWYSDTYPGYGLDLDKSGTGDWAIAASSYGACRLIKLDGSGTELWTQNFALNINGTQSEALKSVKWNSSGGLYGVAIAVYSFYGTNACFVNFDQNGDTTSIDRGNNYPLNDWWKNGLTLTSDGGVAYTSAENSNLTVVKYYGQTTGIKEEAERLSVYPNPTINSVTINALSFGDKVELYDLNGRLVKTLIATGANVDLSDLTTGIYQVIIPEKKAFARIVKL